MEDDFVIFESKIVKRVTAAIMMFYREIIAEDEIPVSSSVHDCEAREMSQAVRDTTRRA